MAKGCVACGRELHDECPSTLEEEDGCCCDDIILPQEEKVGNRKPDNEITVSAGRKRAAVAFEIIPEKPCEWRWQKNCGGGKFPIVGCVDGRQQDRHHGPVKDTHRNEPGNLHRICKNCHNRYHTLNDPDYKKEIAETLPHRPVPATLEECMENEINWKSGKYSSKILEQSKD